MNSGIGITARCSSAVSSGPETTMLLGDGDGPETKLVFPNVPFMSNDTHACPDDRPVRVGIVPDPVVVSGRYPNAWPKPPVDADSYPDKSSVLPRKKTILRPCGLQPLSPEIAKSKHTTISRSPSNRLFGSPYVHTGELNADGVGVGEAPPGSVAPNTIKLLLLS